MGGTSHPPVLHVPSHPTALAPHTRLVFVCAGQEWCAWYGCTSTRGLWCDVVVVAMHVEQGY